jgi:hypothetical protein
VRPHRLTSTIHCSAGSVLHLQYVTACVDGLFDPERVQFTSRGIRFHYCCPHRPRGQKDRKRRFGSFTSASRHRVFWLDPYRPYHHCCKCRFILSLKILSHSSPGIGLLRYALYVQTACVIFVRLSQLYVVAFLGIYGGLAAVVFSPIAACRVVRAVFEPPSRRCGSLLSPHILFSNSSHGRRTTTGSTAFSSWDTSRSSRSAPQDTGIQLTTRINLSQYISPLIPPGRTSPSL